MYCTRGLALSISKGIDRDRDRAVDESGNQIAFSPAAARAHSLAKKPPTSICTTANLTQSSTIHQNELVGAIVRPVTEGVGQEGIC
jgi:hypothetical protein